MKTLFILLAFASSVFCDDTDQKVTYWIAESDTSGWTIQNINADFPVYIGTTAEQASAIQNIALNDVRLRNGVLARPSDPRKTRILTYDTVTASAWMRGALPPYGSLPRTTAILFADYAVDRLSLSIADTITVVRTVVDSAGVNTTTPVIGFRKTE